MPWQDDPIVEDAAPQGSNAPRSRFTPGAKVQWTGNEGERLTGTVTEVGEGGNIFRIERSDGEQAMVGNRYLEPVGQEQSGGGQGGSQPRQTQQQAAPWKNDPVVQEENTEGIMRVGNRGFFGGMNRAVADVFGAPVDIASAGMRGVGIPVGDAPFGGSQSIQRAMEAGDVAVTPEGEQPESFPAQVGYGVGGAAGAVLPFGLASRALQGGGQVAQGVGQAMMRPAVETPVRAGAAEIAAGAGAGAGGMGGEELGRGIGRGMGSEQTGAQVGRLGGELAGSVVGAAGPVGLVSGTLKTAEKFPLAGMLIRGGRRAITPFTQEGSYQRAGERVRSMAADPQRAGRRLEEEPISDITSAQQTGEEGLMALERSVLDTDRALDEQFKQRTAQSSEQLRQALREPAGDMTLDQTRQFIRNRRDYMTGLMEQRIQQANERAQERIAQLDPQMRTAQSSSIAREEIDKALQAARQQERQIWSQVPQDAEVPTTASRRRYEEFEAELPRAQRDRIPTIARRFLAADSNEKVKPVETVKEMRGVYSELRESAREARANDDWNQARIADDLANSVLEDLGASATPQTAAGEAINAARAFSRDLNQRFSQGTVGRLLGYTREGGQATPAETTLDVTVGRSGNQAAVAYDDIQRAVQNNPQQADAAIQDYLTRRFTEHTMRNNEFDPQRASTFVSQNNELLQRFPELRARMSNAEQAQRLASQTQRRLQGRAEALRDPAQSRAAEFLDSPLDREFEKLLRPSQRSPAEMARELRRQAAKDTTGEALKGLKGGFYDYLLRQTKTGDVDEAGNFLMSGRRMLNLMANKRVRSAAQEIFSNKEMERLTTIGNEMANIERSMRTGPARGGIVGDTPAKMLSSIAAILGAGAGRAMNTGTIQTPGIVSGRFKEWAGRLTQDRAEALIRDAVTKDPELFRALLMDLNNPRNRERAQRRLISWLESYTGQQIADQEEDQRNGP